MSQLNNPIAVPMSPVERELQRQLETITSIQNRLESLYKALEPVLKDRLPQPEKPVSPPEEHCRISSDICNRTDELIHVNDTLFDLERRLGI